MAYIGGSLQAPIGFSHETFKDAFEQLVQAGFENLDPSAIGKGADLDTNRIRLKISTVWIEESALLALESSLGVLYPEFTIVIEAIGDEQVVPKEEYTLGLSSTVSALMETRQQAVQLRHERIERDALQQQMNSMSVDELRSAGRYEEAAEREDQEWRMSDAGLGGNDPDWFAG